MYEICFKHGVTGIQGVKGQDSGVNYSDYPIFVTPDGLVRFNVGRSGPVRVVLCDVSGKMVAILADGNKEPGKHFVPIPEKVPAGVYFVSFQMSGGNLMKKALLVR